MIHRKASTLQLHKVQGSKLFAGLSVSRQGRKALRLQEAKFGVPPFHDRSGDLGLQDSKVAWLQGSKVTRLQESKVADFYGFKAPRFQSSGVHGSRAETLCWRPCRNSLQEVFQ